MKRILSLIIAIALVFSMIPTEWIGIKALAVATASGTCGDNLIWTLDSEGILTISGTGNMGNYSSSGSAPWYSFSDSIKKIIVEDGTTRISKAAFYGCGNLETLVIPFVGDCLKTSEDNYWYPLGYIFGENIYDGGQETIQSWVKERSPLNIKSSTYYIPTSLKSVTVTGGEVLYGAFYNCANLTNITIGEAVTGMGDYIFYGCSSLKKLVVPFVGTSRQTATDTYQYPIGLWFGKSSYNKAEATKQFYYGSSTSSTTSSTYYIPTSLQSVTVTGGEILYGAFYNCARMTSVTIGEGVTRISASAFEGCTRLTAVYYCGTVSQKSNISISTSGNRYLTSAHWYYESCFNTSTHSYHDCYDTVCDVCGDMREITHTYVWVIDQENNCGVAGVKHEECSVCHIKRNENTFIDETGNHKYGNACDADCDVCGNTRTVPNHSYTLNGNHTCDICKYSKTPDKPVIESTTNNSVTLVTIDGCEYSKDGITWQSGNVFTNLLPNTTYTFYQRVQESEMALVGSMSEGVSVTLQPNIAATGTCGLYGDNIIWQLDSDGTLTLSGEGEMANYSITKKGPYTKYDFNTVVVSEAVTNIGEWAFYGCSSLESIQFSNSIIRIENYAFDGCSSLKSVQLSDSIIHIGNSAFYECSGLENISLPSSLRSIGNYAFYGCVGLEHIDIADGVSDIGYYTFSGCKSLTSIEIPDSVSSIGDCILSGCSGLTYIKIPFVGSSVTTNKTLGYLFDYNVPKSLKRVKLGEVCKSIGDSAFEDCRSLTSIEIPDSVKTIGEKAFWRCEGLTSVEIPDSVTNIGYAAFEYCDLEEIKLSSNLTSIASDLFHFCNKLTSIEIPDSVTSIGNYAFGYCSSLTTINIPKNVSKIGYWAFAGCNSLTSIKIPDGVQTLEIYIFSGCDNLESIEIPRSLTSIGHNAVSGCNNLTMIRYRGPEADSKKIVIDEGNERLKEITWYYDMCEGEHIYETCEDITCGQCLYVREPVSHLFTLNLGLTCEYCGYSKKPGKPQLESKTWNKIVLVPNDIFEYSMDGVTWQNSSAFSELSGDQTYTFYQRIKQSTIAKASEASEVLIIYLKGSQAEPSAPTVSSFTDTKVTLLQISNGEYSRDGITWQTSNVFENLSSGTKYTFYQRYAETDTREASEASAGTSITTDKSKQTLIPDAPTVQSVTANSITLVAVDGLEYSKNGTTWQSSNVFIGLSCGMEYTFYQRYKETSSTYVGKSSEGTIGKTDKGMQTAPSRPSLSKKTHNSVTLAAYSGYEYSKDGINWQTSNVFAGLNPETNYLFYQRKAENDRYYASSSSISLTVKTDEEPQYITGDFNNDEAVTDADALYLLYHTIFGDSYPIEQDCDYNHDGSVTDADALYLLYHTIHGDSYPLN